MNVNVEVSGHLPISQRSAKTLARRPTIEVNDPKFGCDLGIILAANVASVTTRTSENNRLEKNSFTGLA